MKREKLCSHALLLPTHLQGSASKRLKKKDHFNHITERWFKSLGKLRTEKPQTTESGESE